MADDVFGLVGTAIENKYQVTSAVGEGGFGVVYRGWHLIFERDIAIKCLKVPGHFTPDAQKLFFDNFRKEGKLLDALSEKHLSIVRVYDFGVTQGRGGVWVPYLVLEWLQGQELEEELRGRGRPYTEQEAVARLRPAVEAIARAHGMSPPIAHRDLKPANLFVVAGERGTTLKVLDFGIAKAMQEGETATRLATRTTSGFSAFSPQYGAPEQYLPKKFGPTGPWTDVHALGLILVEMVTGRPPLDGETQFELVGPATSAERPTPRARGAQVSEGFEAMCAKAVALQPTARFKDALALLEAMDALAALGAATAPRQAPPAGRAGTHLSVGTFVPGTAAVPPPAAVAPTRPEAMGPATQLAGSVRTYTPATEPRRPATGALQARQVQTDLTAEKPGSGGTRLSKPVVVGAVAGGALVVVGIVVTAVVASQRRADSERGTSPPAATTETPETSPPAATTETPKKTPAATVKAAGAIPPGYVRIEPGAFMMGSPDGEKGRNSDETQHRVTLTRGFLMKATEVTQGEWEAVMGGNPSHFKPCGASCPVENVRWYEVVAYCNALSAKEGLERCYQDGGKDYDASSASSSATPQWASGLECKGYRLPTEAEWEYAARAGTTTAFFTGEITEPMQSDPNLDKAGWYDQNAGGTTHPVKQKVANAWGLYDMHGNVWEWTWDWKADYGSGEQRDPVGPASGSDRVGRGGSWRGFAGGCRSAYRDGVTPGYRGVNLGFRPSRSYP